MTNRGLRSVIATRLVKKMQQPIMPDVHNKEALIIQPF